MSELRADTITASDGTSPVTLTKQSAPKAWLSYDQSVPTVNDSFNQSSTTDFSVGRCNLNFTNSMTNKHYSVAGVGASTVIFCQRTTDNNATNASSASSCRVESFYFSGSSVTYYDSKPITMVVNGDLAT